MDYMRFCQMVLNGGVLNGVRLLREETVRMMTTNQFGFGVMPNTEDVHEQLRGAYWGGGFWSMCFRISPRGDWIIIIMSQKAADLKLHPIWSSKYQTLAAEAIEE